MHMPLLSFVPNLVRYDVHAIRTLIESFVVRLREMEVVWVDYSGNAPQVVSLRAIISTLGRVLVEVEAEFKSWSHEDVQRFLRHGFFYVRQRIVTAYNRWERGDEPDDFLAFSIPFHPVRFPSGGGASSTQVPSSSASASRTVHATSGVRCGYLSFDPTSNSTVHGHSYSQQSSYSMRSDSINLQFAGQGQPTQNHGFDANAAYYPPPPGPPPGRNHPLSPMSPRIGGAARPPVPGPSGYALPQESAYNAQQSASPNTFLYPIPARSQEPRPPERTVVQALPPDVLIAQETAVHLLEIINKAVSLIIQLNAL